MKSIRQEHVKEEKKKCIVHNTFPFIESCSGSCIRHLYHHHQTPAWLLCLPKMTPQQAMLHPPPLSPFLPVDELEVLLQHAFFMGCPFVEAAQ
jgi:hypothetical protein